MHLTSAEKQRRYREQINADPEKKGRVFYGNAELAGRRQELKINEPTGNLSERERAVK